MSEHEHQAAVIQWARLAQYPGLDLLFAVPNGGLRTKAEAGKLKAEGVKSGVPDLCLPVARGPYHGLFLEMKKPGVRRASEAQNWWIESLMKQGYFAHVASGVDEAIAVLKWYCKGASPKIT